MRWLPWGSAQRRDMIFRKSLAHPTSVEASYCLFLWISRVSPVDDASLVGAGQAAAAGAWGGWVLCIVQQCARDKDRDRDRDIE